MREVDRDTLEPILFLLQSSDIEVQRAASAALGNLAVNGWYLPFLQRGVCFAWSLTRRRREQGLDRYPRRAGPFDPPNDVAQRGSAVQCSWVYHQSSYARREQGKDRSFGCARALNPISQVERHARPAKCHRRIAQHDPFW